VDTVDAQFSWYDMSLDKLPVRDTLLKKITLTRIYNSMLVSWEGPGAGVNGIKGYEIKVNNETVALTDGNIFVYPNLVRCDCYVFNVVALSDDNSILDNRSFVYAPYEGNTFNCGKLI
jgi:hypothetical protein